MPGQYYDAVLDNLRPIYNGTPEDTVIWLRTHPEAKNFDVCIGATMQMVTVTEYLEKAPAPLSVKDEGLLAEVTQLVLSAMHKQDVATYHGDNRGMDLVADAISRKIVKLFEEDKK